MSAKKLEQIEIEAPYELPEGWKWDVLGRYFTHTTGKALKKDSTVGSLKEYITTSNLYWNSFDFSDVRKMYFTNDELEKCTATQGDLLVCNGGDVGRAAIWNYDYNICLQNHISKLRRTADNVSTEYFYYIFLFYKNSGLLNGKGIGISSLSAKAITELVVPLPPTLAEQKRIVGRIETLFAKLDEAEEKTRAVLDSFETRKAAILHKAFTGEQTANWRKENDVADDSWEEKTIGDCFFHTTGKALKKDNQVGILHKYITTSNLYWGEFDFSEVREMYFTDEELEKCTAKKGDLLICNGGDVGRAAIWDFDYDICLQNHVSKLRKKENNIETRFFFYYFMFSKIKGNVNGKGIGISSLSAKDLLAMDVSLPSLPEQQEIVRILDTVLDKKSRAKEAAQTVLDQIALLKKSILACAFRGEL